MRLSPGRSRVHAGAVSDVSATQYPPDCSPGRIATRPARKNDCSSGPGGLCRQARRPVPAPLGSGKVVQLVPSAFAGDWHSALAGVLSAACCHSYRCQNVRSAFLMRCCTSWASAPQWVQVCCSFIRTPSIWGERNTLPLLLRSPRSRSDRTHGFCDSFSGGRRVVLPQPVWVTKLQAFAVGSRRVALRNCRRCVLHSCA